MKFTPKDSSQTKLLNAYLRNKDHGLFANTSVFVDMLLEVVYDKESVFYNSLPSAEAKFYAVVLAALIIVNGMDEVNTPDNLNKLATMILEPAPGLTPNMLTLGIVVAGLIDYHYSH